MGATRRVLVTGVAAIGPVGLDADTCFDALLAGRSGIGPITAFDASGFSSRIAGEVRGFAAENWLDPKDVRKTDRFIHFAVAAASMAIESAGLDLERVDRDRAGVVIGSGIGGLRLLEEQHRVFLERGPRRISPFLIPGMIINMAGGMVSMKFGLRGPNSATVTACATGNHAIGEALRILQHGDADVMIAGGTEAVICPMAVGGFCSMRALSTRNDEPERASRPFDRDRDGFVMGEGCGLLVLETEEHARRRGARPLAELAGLGMSADAWHMSAPEPSGDGMKRVMRAALADAGLSAADIDYVNAHGTSTPAGDVVEARAIREVFGAEADRVAVSSTKSMVGHLLGAAGGFEAVVTVLSVARGAVHPTVNVEHQDPEVRLDVVREGAREMPVRAALTNSFGFGGTNACLVFRRA